METQDAKNLPTEIPTNLPKNEKLIAPKCLKKTEELNFNGALRPLQKNSNKISKLMRFARAKILLAFSGASGSQQKINSLLWGVVISCR